LTQPAFDELLRRLVAGGMSKPDLEDLEAAAD